LTPSTTALTISALSALDNRLTQTDGTLPNPAVREKPAKMLYYKQLSLA